MDIIDRIRDFRNSDAGARYNTVFMSPAAEQELLGGASNPSTAALPDGDYVYGYRIVADAGCRDDMLVFAHIGADSTPCSSDWHHDCVFDLPNSRTEFATADPIVVRFGSAETSETVAPAEAAWDDMDIAYKLTWCDYGYDTECDVCEQTAAIRLEAAAEIARLRAQVDELLLMAVPFAVHHLLHGEDEWAEAFLDRVNAGEFGGRV